MTKVNLYLDKVIWLAFRVACLQHGTSASKEIERMIRERINSWTLEQEGNTHE